MPDVKFTDQHEWVSVESGVATMGITAYATEQLGDIVYVELPEVGRSYGQGEELAVVESVKAASEVYAPVGGEVTEINDAVTEDPARVNSSPDEEGWLVKLKVSDPGEISKLMDKEAYTDYVGGLS